MIKMNNSTAPTTSNDIDDSEESEGGDERLPANLRRAAVCRTKAARFRADFVHLDRWQKNACADKAIQQLRETLGTAIDALESAGDMYEALTPAMLVTKRGRGTGTAAGLVKGARASVKAKYAPTYLALTGGEPVDNLLVIDRRDTHVLVETASGERLFVAAKELEPVAAE